MKRISYTLFGLAVSVFLLSGYVAEAKTKISGRVTYNGQTPMANANISVDGTYDGATADSGGNFSFETEEYGPQILIARMNGYEDVVQPIQVTDGATLKVELVFTLKVARLNEVIVRSKGFEGNDRYKVTILNMTDILTTATDGNVMSALKTLPGAQQVGESGELFIRGGAGYETKTFIDGLQVNNFTYSTTSNMSSRSRFPAGMFKGTFFSSSGYSALYGQALSGALLLETTDIPTKSSADISISPVFVGGGIQKVTKDNRTSYGGNINYTNLTPYYNLAKPNMQFDQKPAFLDGSVTFRHKITEKGMLKFYGSYGQSNMVLQQPDLNYEQAIDQVGLRNHNLYTNLTYKQYFDKGWQWYIGTSYSQNHDNLNLRVAQADELLHQNNTRQSQSMLQLRTVLSKPIFSSSKLLWGAEYQYETDHWKDYSKTQSFTDQYAAVFAETETYLAPNVPARFGMRLEHSTLLNKSSLAPRASVGYNFLDGSLLSFAYGMFYQKPQNNYLRYDPKLDFSQATHYTLTFQKADNYHTFRSELYYKKYNQLVKTIPDLNSSGSGYASGLEVFWRDKKTLKRLDYWVSYSYLDTKRNYLNYLYATQPMFAATHTASLVVKRFFSKISTNISATYTFATGRPYFNPNRSQEDFMTDRTMQYNNLGLNIAYLPKIKNTFSVIVLTVSNVLGNQQVFGYTYSNVDYSRRTPITPVANPFVFLGFFMNFGVDRTDDIINGRL